MNMILEKIKEEYADDPLFIEQLEKSQEAWLVFRDAQLYAVFPGESGEEIMSRYGSVYPMCVYLELEHLTKQRIEQLRVWLNGTEVGNVCAGSIKVNW